MKTSLILAVLSAFLLPVYGSSNSDAESRIKATLNAQVEAWNRGDIPTFVTTYTDDCIFVGKPVLQGRAQLLARYQERYPTPAAMGHLTFSEMAIHLLDKEVAIVTADWHLDRDAAGGGPVGGYFSLVLHRQSGAWKVALDHTSGTP
jgi:uncharacterized protein (TIGR02246 family)